MSFVQIGHKSSTSSLNNYNFTSVSGDGEDGNGELLLGGLSKYTRYTIVAQAFNQIGVGPLSEPATTTTMEDVPSSPPLEIRCSMLSSHSLQVSWQPPNAHNTNGILIGYKLTYEAANWDNYGLINDDIETRKTNALTIILNNLRKNANYSIQALAYTRMGDGVISPPTYCQTEEDGKLLF